ncbi:hypothetical protein M407DRAFT_91983 [Tulasnella calospora MUT 4182]|uniref:Fork-head domain-containing protein n=1 Tax=Tulasnella calospora MUT 4182 TaxID=1051891 RepID=A0A0C3LVL7_9AGAM|nr:hypothetical protein M407DRAFT_91983 [Tulasnella calospora MUT 4182]
MDPSAAPSQPSAAAVASQNHVNANGSGVGGDDELDDQEPEMMMADGQILDSPPAPHDTRSGGGRKGKGSAVKRPGGGGHLVPGPDIANEPAKVSLSDLKDCPPGVKPYHAYSTLIRYAIKGSPGGKLLLEDIYEALMNRFEYFRTAPPGWKNSVRHNLSLNPMFVKVERPLTDRGKGYYWTVRDDPGLDARTGVHRNRKKKTQQAAAAVAAAVPGASPVPGPSGPPGGHPYPPQQYVIPEDHVAALQAHFNPYPRDTLVPDVTPNGEVDWQASWWNEITKLQQFTAQQEKAGVGSGWYRWMFEHMRAAFGHPAVIGTATGTVHVGQLPDMGQQQQPQGGQPGALPAHAVPPPHAEGESMDTDSGEGNVGGGGDSHEGDPDESE